MIYFIQGTHSKNIKIGLTHKTDEGFQTRLNAMQSSDVLVVLRVIENSNDERFYQDKFKHLWSHGEWFTPDLDMLDFIKSLPLNRYEGMKQIVLSPWKRYSTNLGRRKHDVD